MTPLFGFNLLYLKSIIPPGITMADIYRSIIPCTLVELAGMVRVIIFPWIAPWLPILILGSF